MACPDSLVASCEMTPFAVRRSLVLERRTHHPISLALGEEDVASEWAGDMWYVTRLVVCVFAGIVDNSKPLLHQDSNRGLCTYIFVSHQES